MMVMVNSNVKNTILLKSTGTEKYSLLTEHLLVLVTVALSYWCYARTKGEVSALANEEILCYTTIYNNL